MRRITSWIAPFLVTPVVVLAQDAPRENDPSSCTDTHSKALCVTAAARLAAGLKDSKPSEIRQYVDRRASDSLWYAGAALGNATKTFSRTPGIPTSVEVGLMLLGMVTSATSKEPDIVGRNMILAWMPASMAADRHAADEKAQQLVLDALMKTFDGSQFTAETIPAVNEKNDYSLSRREQIRYRVTGGKCEGHECYLTPQMMQDPQYGILGTRGRKGQAPSFVGTGEAFVFSERPGAIWAWALVVDGKPKTHSYLPELSKHLPSWMYVVISPEKRYSDGMVFNEGQKIPVVFQSGQALYFAFPEVSGQPKVSMN